MKTKIILIVGPSGVGKDTLLRAARKKLKENECFNFVKRYITRKPDSNEKNFYLKDKAFFLLKQSSYFLSSWEAHDNYYGIAKECIQPGVNIISTSRGHIKDFEHIFEDVTTVHVTIPKALLLSRLRLRGRESEAQIMARLKRMYDNIEARECVEFDNSLSFEESTTAFVQLIKSI